MTFALRLLGASLILLAVVVLVGSRQAAASQNLRVDAASNFLETPFEESGDVRKHPDPQQPSGGTR